MEAAYSSCWNGSSITIPDNATTTLNAVPSWTKDEFEYIPIFPWTSESCAKAYLEAVSVGYHYTAFTFLPDRNMTTVPDASDPVWKIGTNNSWQEDFRGALFAIGAADALPLISQLSRYSGNISSAPFGTELTHLYGAESLARILISTSTPFGPFRVLGWPIGAGLTGAIVLIGLILLLWAWYMRQRRFRSFQKRLQRGEIDLEALGIKKMNVPEEVIDQMTLRTFTASLDTSKPDLVAGIGDLPKDHNFAPSAEPRSAEEMFSTSSQTTCPVCLDDFVHGVTRVRELPCKHIFHPECIDLYLRDTSALCPMCKLSALPLGYCPVKITEFMVDHERNQRRIRERQSAHSRPRYNAQNTGTGINHAGSTHVNVHEDVEMTARSRGSETTLTNEAIRAYTNAVPAEIAARGDAARRAWHRERLAEQQERVFAVASEDVRRAMANRPRWRRIFGRVIPSTG